MTRKDAHSRDQKLASRPSPGRLVFEIGTEELPPSAVKDGLSQLDTAVPAGFRAARINVEAFRYFGTPRRLVVIADGVSRVQQDAFQEIRGPAVRAAFGPDGKPTAAALGFARAQGVPLGELQRRSTPQGEYVYAVRREAGKPAVHVLKVVLPTVVEGLAFAKTMHWGTGNFRFPRPVRWVLALLDSRVIALEVVGLRAGRRTYGHRFLHPGALMIKDAAQYETRLHESSVLLDPAARRTRIMNECFRQANAISGQPILDPDLLDETVQLAEWPTVFTGAIAPQFLDLPREVLITVMQHHQKYFAIQDDHGDLLPAFVAIRDGGTRGLGTVREGNEWVLGARLSDAKFFFEEDSRKPLSSRVDELKELVLHEKLGSVWAKTRRLEQLALHVTNVFDLDAVAARNLKRAAHLSKADLVTLMVRELPELQGIMGGLYARKDGEPKAVCDAIAEQYLPRGQVRPESPVGKSLAILDRVDALTGALAVGTIASGSEDPYGLRRAATGIVQIIILNGIHLSMQNLLAASLDVHGVDSQNRRAAVIHSALEMIHQRFRTEMTVRGISYDTVDAVLASGADDLADAEARTWALDVFRKSPQFTKVFKAFDRAMRILPRGFQGEIRESLIRAPAEICLFNALRSLEPLTLQRQRSFFKSWLPSQDDNVAPPNYDAILKNLTELAGPVNQFFDDVLVMDENEEIRANRMALLSGVVDLIRPIADLSRLAVGEGSAAMASQSQTPVQSDPASPREVTP